jgi:hypothetical protein
MCRGWERKLTVTVGCRHIRDGTSLVAFALTLKLVYFFVILGASLALFGVLANMMEKEASTES